MGAASSSAPSSPVTRPRWPKRSSPPSRRHPPPVPRPPPARHARTARLPHHRRLREPVRAHRRRTRQPARCRDRPLRASRTGRHRGSRHRGHPGLARRRPGHRTAPPARPGRQPTGHPYVHRDVPGRQPPGHGPGQRGGRAREPGHPGRHRQIHRAASAPGSRALARARSRGATGEWRARLTGTGPAIRAWCATSSRPRSPRSGRRGALPGVSLTCMPMSGRQVFRQVTALMALHP
jgi:hypothetical protein